jgi:hypothetical protein
LFVWCLICLVWLSADLLIHRCVSVWHIEIHILCSLQKFIRALLFLCTILKLLLLPFACDKYYIAVFLLKKLPFFSPILFLFIYFSFCQIESFFPHPQHVFGSILSKKLSFYVLWKYTSEQKQGFFHLKVYFRTHVVLETVGGGEERNTKFTALGPWFGGLGPTHSWWTTM